MGKFRKLYTYCYENVWKSTYFEKWHTSDHPCGRTDIVFQRSSSLARFPDVSSSSSFSSFCGTFSFLHLSCIDFRKRFLDFSWYEWSPTNFSDVGKGANGSRSQRKLAGARVWRLLGGVLFLAPLSPVILVHEWEHLQSHSAMVGMKQGHTLRLFWSISHPCCTWFSVEP